MGIFNKIKNLFDEDNKKTERQLIEEFEIRFNELSAASAQEEVPEIFKALISSSINKWNQTYSYYLKERNPEIYRLSVWLIGIEQGADRILSQCSLIKDSKIKSQIIAALARIIKICIVLKKRYGPVKIRRFRTAA